MDWAIVLDAFCSACKNETREASVSLPGVKRRQRVAADRDRIRRSLLAGASQADQQATAVLRAGARGVELIGAGGADRTSGVRARWS